MNFSEVGSVSFRVIEGLRRDVRYACRSFLRAPLAALTIVMTVGLGLGLVAVVFSVLNSFVFRVADDVRNPHELFALTRPQSVNAAPATFTRAQYVALLRETGVFSAAFASAGEIDAWIEGRRLEGPLVTGNYFQVLGASAARGRTIVPSDDQPGALPVIVLSHRAWSLHFSADPSVVNGTIRVNGASFHVVGVMPEGFRGLAALAAPDFWAPLSALGQFQRGSGAEHASIGLHIVGRLKPGLSPGQALAQLLVWDSRTAAGLVERRAPDSSVNRSATNLVLEPSPGTIPLSTDVMQLFAPLFFAFGLILVIGCANVANLLLARAVARQREIGIRLAIGASRRRLIQQLLTESLLLALVSAALAFGISRLVLSGVVYAVTSTFPPDIGNVRLVVPPADWRVALFLVAGAMVSTVFFALAPAFQATRVELVRAIRGEVVRDGRPSRARDALVALQVTGSALLLICAAVFLRSSWAAAKIDLGIRTTGILNISVLNEQRRAAILDVVKREPLVASVAASSPSWLGGQSAFAEASSRPGAAGGKSSVTYQFVSPEYFAVFDVDLVRGRGFAETERSADAAVAVVSESVARELWPGMDAVGQVFRLDPDLSGVEETGKTRQPDDPLLRPRTVAVVGVARDVEGLRLAGMTFGGAGVYLPTSGEAAGTSLSLRVRGDSERARHALVERMVVIDPNMGEISSLQTFVRGGAYLLAIPFWVTLGLGALALLLTLSGLFSVLSYLVEQRTREIGVRMALGATSRAIGALVLLQSARPVAIGMFLGGSLAVGIGAALLALPAAALIGSIVRLFDPVAYVASLLCIVTACACAALIPALRAARIDPVGALRQL